MKYFLCFLAILSLATAAHVPHDAFAYVPNGAEPMQEDQLELFLQANPEMPFAHHAHIDLSANEVANVLGSFANWSKKHLSLPGTGSVSKMFDAFYEECNLRTAQEMEMENESQWTGVDYAVEGQVFKFSKEQTSNGAMMQMLDYLNSYAHARCPVPLDFMINEVRKAIAKYHTALLSTL